MIHRIKKLIMESLPNEGGAKTDYNTLYSSVGLYCSEVGIPLARVDFNYALRSLSDDQCLVRFSDLDIRPTQYGLNKYSSW